MKLLFEKQVKAGDRIEQAVFKKYEEKIETRVVEELDSSESGYYHKLS